MIVSLDPGSARLIKHAADRIGAAVLLVIVAPLMLVVAIALTLDGGPVLARQTRVGRHGREFGMLAFRSTVDGAGGRRSLVGAAVRRHGVHVLPQLFNVLGGTMSLVGPRPLLPTEVGSCTLLVRPGLTGVWLVSDRSYVEDWDLALDGRIMAASIGAALTNRQAY